MAQGSFTPRLPQIPAVAIGTAVASGPPRRSQGCVTFAWGSHRPARPTAADNVTMPAQARGRGDDQPHPAGPADGQRPGKQGQPRPVRPCQPASSAGSPAQGDSRLMTQHQDPGVSRHPSRRGNLSSDMAPGTVTKTTFNPASRRSSHARRAETDSPGAGPGTALCRASAQVTPVFGTHNTRTGRPTPGRNGHAPRVNDRYTSRSAYRTSSPVTARPMIIRWISDVPSKIVKILAVRAVYAGQRPAEPPGISTDSARPVRDEFWLRAGLVRDWRAGRRRVPVGGRGRPARWRAPSAAYYSRDGNFGLLAR